MIELPLSQGFVAIIDDEDAHLAAHKWSLQPSTNGRNYAMRQEKLPGGKHTSVLLHRCILGLKKGDPLVDHIDGDGLNCRRHNIRVATKTINNRNIGGPRIDNRHSKYLGVYRQKNNPAWLAHIRVNGVRHHLGSFKTEDAANLARLAAERHYWGIHPRREEAHRRALNENPHDNSASCMSSADLTSAAKPIG